MAEKRDLQARRENKETHKEINEARRFTNI